MIILLNLIQINQIYYLINIRMHNQNMFNNNTNLEVNI